MTPAVVDLLQPVQIKQKYREGPSGTIGASDLCIEDFREPAVVGQARKRIAGRQITELLLHCVLLGHVHGYDLEAPHRPLVVAHFSSAQGNLYRRAVLAFAPDFGTIEAAHSEIMFKQLRPFGGIVNDIGRQVQLEQFLR